MGLESVELVIEFEEEFGIQIPDADCERLYTLGAVIRYVAVRQGVQAALGCVTAASFYAVRSLLMREFGVTRSAVRPEASVMKLVGRSRREALDQRLRALGVDFAIGRRVSDPGNLFAATAYLATAVIGFVAIASGIQSPAAAVVLVALVATAVVGALIVRRRYAASAATMRDVVIALAAPARTVVPDDPCIQRIRDKVYAIVSEQLGIDRASLSDSISFVHDLGI